MRVGAMRYRAWESLMKAGLVYARHYMVRSKALASQWATSKMEGYCSELGRRPKLFDVSKISKASEVLVLSHRQVIGVER